MTAPSQDDLKHLAQRIWIPAVAGAVGSGGLAGYLASKSQDPNETSGQRRTRILRNALAGSALGGVAGGATEEGARALYQPFFGDTDKKPAVVDRAIGAATGFGARHAAGLGTLGVGGTLLLNQRQKAHETAARKLMLAELGGKTSLPVNGKSIDISDIDTMHDALRGNPTNVDVMLGHLLHARQQRVSNPNTPAGMLDMDHAQGEFTHPGGGLHYAKDLLNEAGYKEQGAPSKLKLLKDILLHKNQPSKGFTPDMRAERDASFSRFLGKQGPASKLVSKLLGAKPIKTLGEHDIDVGEIPELYRRTIRPSIKYRVPLPVQLGLLGGGAYAANRIQKRLMGQ